MSEQIAPYGVCAQCGAYLPPPSVMAHECWPTMPRFVNATSPSSYDRHAERDAALSTANARITELEAQVGIDLDAYDSLTRVHREDSAKDRARIERLSGALKAAQTALHDAWCHPDRHVQPCIDATDALAEMEP